MPLLKIRHADYMAGESQEYDRAGYTALATEAMRLSRHQP